MAYHRELNFQGILLEATHPESGQGQFELNFVPAQPMEMADRHILAKQALHEMAMQSSPPHELCTTFMAKPAKEAPGSSCQIHMSLEHIESGKAAFYDADAELGMSKVARAWLAGLLKYASECTYFLAPYINSYKRLQPGSFAPIKVCWSVENRTSAFRVCGEHSAHVHIECRLGGADLNPYLAFAALLAAGMAGIEEGLELCPPISGNAYARNDLPQLPHTLLEAIEQLDASTMLKRAFGEPSIRHYLHAARLEQSDFDTQVTDWELQRGFDRA